MNGSHAKSGGPGWLRYIDHTADVGIAVEAEDIPILFRRAAWGMFSLVTELSLVRESVSTHVRVEAHDPASLMVRWLSELNYMHQTDHRVFSRFDMKTVTETELDAEVWGEAFDPARHRIHAEIKAVTYHRLKVERSGKTWKAEILFDV